MSHILLEPVDEPIPKLAMWHDVEASTIMCWPVLNPHMTGEPVFPGAVIENVSVMQSPIDPTRNIKNNLTYIYLPLPSDMTYM